MKDKFIIGILLLLLVACDKYNSTIEGSVLYEQEKNLYKAPNAIVYKQVVQKEDTINIIATSCDSNGCFLFDNTTKGTWRLKGKIVLDSAIYEGCSSVFTTKGTDKVVVPDIVLQLVSTND